MRIRFIRLVAAAALLASSLGVQARVVKIDVPDAETWKNDALAACGWGDTVQFDVPIIVNQNWGYGGFSGLKVSVRRVFSPTNQALPKSDEFYELQSLNSKATFTLTGCGYRRDGERLHNLTGVVTGDLTVKYISGKWEGNNTRDALKNNVPSVDMNGVHNVLVCAANLEYYLVKALGTGFGPRNYTEHQRQRTKVKQALAKIHADVYGFVEIEQGQDALVELAADLTELTGDTYDYIRDSGTSSETNSYTKSGYVYNSDKIKPVGRLISNNTGVANRKKVQAFVLKSNNERFIFSINHFKAKSGSGTGMDADQQDGQGIFNYKRTVEAQSIVRNMRSYQNAYADNDVLIMGDLNAYAKEDPIQTLLDAGMFDLHRRFHADSSYSYVYAGQAGYLDHAIANDALIKQVTGMAVWHVNSDESDEYTYDSSYDQTVFRYSDHDPVLVGLKLDSTRSIPLHAVDPIDYAKISISNGELFLSNVSQREDNNGDPLNGYYEIYDVTGHLVQGITLIEESPCPVGEKLTSGVYVVRVYYAGKIKALKLMKLLK
ncbi:MAG: endonuclease/exonuclease/phosphatase family protein [Paludibacteraceae bacterium]|nr:endonuclease/exonuclease/phosphatase family protein [Paludibacteraceae bacterium]